MKYWALWVEEDQRFAFSPTDNGGTEVSDEEHASLFAGASTGKIIGRAMSGVPELQDPPAPTLEELEAAERGWRDGELAKTDSSVVRHRDEIEDGAETTLTPSQYAELQDYRRQLRNWPQGAEFPMIDHRPSPPTWLSLPTAPTL